MNRTFNYITPELNNAVINLSKYLKLKGIKHVVIGGVAVGQYTKEPRVTIDIDIFTTEDVERVMPNLGPLNEVEGIASEWEGIPVEFIYPYGDEADLIFSNCKLVDGIPVASRDALLYMKLRAGRTKDSDDLVQMLKQIRPEERAYFIKKLDSLKNKNFPRDLTELVLDFQSLGNIADLEQSSQQKSATSSFRKHLLVKAIK